MKRTSKKNPALVELILVILFFSLSSVILVQVFAKAKKISDLSRSETLGMIYAQGLIEKWKIDPVNEESLFFQNGWIDVSENDVLSFYCECDENMIMLQNDEGISKYHVQVEISKKIYEGGTLYEMSVEILRIFDSEKIVSLSTARYISETEVLSQ